MPGATLLESKAKPYGSGKGAFFSLVFHAALVAAAVVGTREVILPPREKVEAHPILYVAPPPPKVYVAPEPLPEVKKAPAPRTPRVQPPRARPQPPPPRQVAAPTPRPAQPQPTAPAAPLVAPINVPTSIPKVDVNAIPTVANVAIPAAEPPRVATSSVGSSSARSSSDGDVEGRSGTRGGLGSGDANRAYSENQVERAVVPTRPPQPRYPESLRSVSVTGEVVVRYIVDARGRVEPGSIKILSSAHNLFSEAVRRALLEARYRPAEVGGRAVRQLVEQPFIFKLDAR